jgi:hypothetical protein
LTHFPEQSEYEQNKKSHGKTIDRHGNANQSHGKTYDCHGKTNPSHGKTYDFVMETQLTQGVSTNQSHGKTYDCHGRANPSHGKTYDLSWKRKRHRVSKQINLMEKHTTVMETQTADCGKQITILDTQPLDPA